MHTEIMQPPPGMEPDHIRPGSGLDNRRTNLRNVDHATNCRNRRLQKNNTSGYRGVTWNKDARKWQAEIKVDGKNHYLGKYSTPQAASAAYEAARERMGLIKAGGD